MMINVYDDDSSLFPSIGGYKSILCISCTSFVLGTLYLVVYVTWKDIDQTVGATHTHVTMTKSVR